MFSQQAAFMVLRPRVRLTVKAAEFNGCRGLPAGFAVFGDYVGEDAAAHVKLGGEAHEARLGGGDQVVEDAVGDIFVKMSLVAERPHVELEAFQFDALRIGDVVQRQRGEIRLSGFGTKTGEFRYLHVDVVVASRSGIGEGFQYFAWFCRHLSCPRV